jgi:hypothetical protein
MFVTWLLVRTRACMSMFYQEILLWEIMVWTDPSCRIELPVGLISWFGLCGRIKIYRYSGISATGRPFCYSCLFLVSSTTSEVHSLSCHVPRLRFNLHLQVPVIELSLSDNSAVINGYAPLCLSQVGPSVTDKRHLRRGLIIAFEGFSQLSSA